MSASDIAALDHGLQTAGFDAILRRVYGQGANAQTSDVRIRTRVLPQTISAQNVGGEERQGTWMVISPTQIKAQGWPGGERPSSARPLPWLPCRGDQIIKVTELATGRWQSIDVVRDPFYVDGAIVRIEFKLLG